MGLFRKKRKPTISPDQLADIMYIGMVRLALKGEGSIHSVLQKFGPPDIDEVVEERELDTMVEVMILAMFPFDVTVARKVGSSIAPTVRLGIRERFLKELQNQIGPLSSQQVQDFHARIDRRFSEYSAGVGDLSGAAGVPNSGGVASDRAKQMIKLGLDIGRNILGRDVDVSLASALVLFVTPEYLAPIAYEIDRYVVSA